MSTFSACPICQSASVRLRFNGYTNRNPADRRVWPVFECADCGHGFINPQPGAATLADYYSASYDAYDDRHGAEGSDEAIVAEAQRTGEFRHIAIPAGKRVLEFGCGGGFFLNICRQLGAEVQGIEPSSHGAEITRRQGIPVFEGSLGQFLVEHAGEQFDVITSNHVIEHVPDPIETFAGLRSLLAPGGTITIAVPNARGALATAVGAEWHSVDLPFHLHQFSRESLRIAAERGGLQVREIGTTSLPAGTAASLLVLLRRKYLIPQRLTKRIPLVQLYSRHLARRYDEQARGEALLARFAA